MVTYRKVETWTCDICKWEHRSEESAMECEAKGSAPFVPRGLCFRFFKGSTDPVYKLAVYAIAEGRKSGHDLDPGMWAARPGKNDNLVNEGLCGGSSWQAKNIYEPDRDSDELRRMVKSLHDNHIPVTIWNDRVMPFEEWYGRSVEEYLGLEKEEFNGDG